MKLAAKRIFAVIALTLSFAAPVAAGPLEDATAANDKGDYATALRLLRELAEQGNARAQFKLGDMYGDGRGVAQSNVEAAKWFSRAGEQGDADAQYNLGVMYIVGQGVAQNNGEALKWFRKAAEQGSSVAQYNLAVMLDNGQGAARNGAEALQWYLRSAEQGYVPAQNNLGLVYDDGKAVPQDFAEAVKWYRKAAERGFAPAQLNLGRMYDNGQGVPQDKTEAVKWISQGCRPGLCPSREHAWEQVLCRQRRAAGFCRGDEVVSQGRRTGRRRSPEQSRRHVCPGPGRSAGQHPRLHVVRFGSDGWQSKGRNQQKHCSTAYDPGRDRRSTEARERIEAKQAASPIGRAVTGDLALCRQRAQG